MSMSGHPGCSTRIPMGNMDYSMILYTAVLRTPYKENEMLDTVIDSRRIQQIEPTAH